MLYQLTLESYLHLIYDNVDFTLLYSSAYLKIDSRFNWEINKTRQFFCIKRKMSRFPRPFLIGDYYDVLFGIAFDLINQIIQELECTVVFIVNFGYTVLRIHNIGSSIDISLLGSAVHIIDIEVAHNAEII